MLLWFIGPAVAAVWLVFRSPALDYRMVVVGALLPMLDVMARGPWVLHTLLGAVLAMGLVMGLTRHRRLVRRRWLGIPIGMFLHLALDFTFTRAQLFWWPFLGTSFGGGGLPELDRPLAVVLVLEGLGAVACWWCWRTFGLDDASRRRMMVHTGQVDRSLAPPE